MPRRARRGLFIWCLVIWCLVLLSPLVARADVKCLADRAEIDGVAVRYGEPVELVGQAVERHWRDMNPGQVVLKVVRVNGRGTQAEILAYLAGAPADFKAEPDKWYAAAVVPTEGASTFSPARLSGTVRRIGVTAAAPLVLVDFVGRDARFEGTAAEKDRLRVGDESLAVAPWPAHVAGKRVEARGVVRKDRGQLRLENPTWRLVELADLVGKTVTLEGRFGSLNGVWWFGYRDQRLIVTDEKDHPVVFTSGRHGGAGRVTGLLVNQLRPSLEQISEKTDRDLVPTYVVRRAKIEFPDPPVDVADRFRTVYPTEHKVVDGVPVLIEEGIVRRNIMGNESAAMDRYQRNHRAIDAVLRAADPRALDVVAARVADAKVEYATRLVYAAMLAAANDRRGRDFLSAAADRRGDDFPSVLYALGLFGFMMPDDAATKTDPRWAEPLAVKLMTERDAAGKLAVARDAANYSDVPDLLVKLDTPATRKALIDYALANVDPPTHFLRGNVLRTIAASKMAVPHEDVLRLEKAIRDPADRRSVLHIALRQNDAAAVALFANELGEQNWFASDFRDNLTPEVVAMLREKQAGLVPAARDEARMLVILAQKDPVPELIGLLNDPTWANKGSAIWELGKLKDARATAPLYKILREGPADYFLRGQEEIWANNRVCNAVNALGSAETPEAIRCLVDLLGDDLTRFSKRYDRASYQRVIAARLIEITGESFGTDHAAWKRWADGKH